MERKKIAEPRDFQLLMGLAKRKYKSDEKALTLLKKVAAIRSSFIKATRSLPNCWSQDKRRLV